VLGASVGVYEDESVLSLQYKHTLSLSLSLSLTHPSLTYPYLSSQILFYLEEKLIGALLFLLTLMGEMPTYTIHC